VISPFPQKGSIGVGKIAEDKMLTISKSPYLKFAYRKLEESERPLPIYGWSISTQDNHILRALYARRTPLRRPLTLSVYISDKLSTDLEEEIFSMRARLSGHRLPFFDSSSLFAY